MAPWTRWLLRAVLVGARPGPRLPGPVHAGTSTTRSASEFAQLQLAGADARLCAAAGAAPGLADGCAGAEDRTGRRVLSQGRRRPAPGHLRPQRQRAGGSPAAPSTTSTARCRSGASKWRCPADASPSVRDADPQARSTARALDPARIATLYGTTGRAPAGAHRGSAGAAGHRPAGGGGSRFQAPPRHRSRRHAARAIWVNMREAGIRAGRQHADPAAGAQPVPEQRPRRSRRKVKEILYALIIEARFDKRTHPGGLPQPGLPGPARLAGDPRRGRRRGILVRPRPARPCAPKQIALLIGIIQGPGYWDPRRNPGARAEARATSCWRSMRRDRTDQRRGSRRAPRRAAGRQQQARQPGAQPRPGLRRPRAPPAGARLSGRCAAGRRPDA